ncbi:MAG: metallophosphoesterase [Clostridiales bacterium]|nr:metallophosphoesterase [Clostridiales bacterium]
MWFLILMAICYLGVNFFLWHRVVRLLKYVHGFLGNKWILALFTLIYVFLMSSVASWALFDDPSWVFAMKYLSNIWIGVMICAIFFMAIAEIVTFILWASKKMRKGQPGYRKYILIRGFVVIALVAGFSIYGLVHAGSLKVTEYELKVDKVAQTHDNLKIVLIADTHIGYSVGNELITEAVRLTNDHQPDIVCIAGDIVDNDYYAIRDADKIQETLSRIKSKYGVYACFGNHDVEEKLIGGFTVLLGQKPEVQHQVYDFIEGAGIQILQDDNITVDDNITIIGRYDMTKPNIDGKKRASIGDLTADLNRDNLIIDIDHQPAELKEKAAAGVDMDLGGHTHDGQIFPGNLTIDLFWDNACGMMKVDDMYSIVTSGVGVWGPAMRVGTDGEIVVINVEFTGE